MTQSYRAFELAASYKNEHCRIGAVLFLFVKKKEDLSALGIKEVWKKGRKKL